MHKAKRAPRFPAKPSCWGLSFYVSLLLAARHRRGRVVTRRDRHDLAIVVDGIHAVLVMLLYGTVWIPREHDRVVMQIVARC